MYKYLGCEIAAKLIPLQGPNNISWKAGVRAAGRVPSCNRLAQSLMFVLPNLPSSCKDRSTSEVPAVNVAEGCRSNKYTEATHVKIIEIALVVKVYGIAITIESPRFQTRHRFAAASECPH